MSEPAIPSAPADAEALAGRLREAREFLNLSQQFVADQTGLPRSAVSDIERGARRVDSLELKRLAALYRLPPSHFLGEDEELVAIDPTARALARATKDMGEPAKQQLLRFAQFLRNYDGDPDPGESTPGSQGKGGVV
jgi:transcriptional regulator with XRE-family HTH domain